MLALNEYLFERRNHEVRVNVDTCTSRHVSM
jgi:hypothetical protein